MKKVKQLFLVCALAFMLCGCYKANVNITVHSDGTADMGMEMLVSESALSYMNATVDDLKKSMMDSMEEDVKESTTIKEISRTYDDEKYVGFEMSYDSEDANPYGFKDIIKVKDDTITFLMDSEDVNELGTDELDDYGTSMDGIEFNMNITMPGKILENNVGEVDGNTVKIDLLTFKEAKIEIKSELGSNDNTMMIVGIGIVAVVVIAGVAFFLMKKKKNNSDTSDMRPIDPNTPVTDETESDASESVEVKAEEVKVETTTEASVNDDTSTTDEKKDDHTEN